MGDIALSYSRLSDYENCPRKFKSKYLTKTYPNDPNNPYFIRGSAIHKQLEDYANARISGRDPSPLSDDIARAGNIIEGVVKGYSIIYTEQQIAVDKDFNSVEWFSKQAYYRAIFDLVAIEQSKALIIDWKSGKVRDYDDSDTGQLHLSSGILMSIKPQIEEVTTAYAFVEHNQTIARKFTRDQLSDLIAPFHKAHAEVNRDKEFLPIKNKYCYFCEIPPHECEYKK